TDCQLALKIVAPDGTTVLGSDSCSGQTGFVDALDGIGPGAYKLRVVNTAAPTGSVKLQVFQFKDPTAAITANGAAVTGKAGAPAPRVLRRPGRPDRRQRRRETPHDPHARPERLVLLLGNQRAEDQLPRHGQHAHGLRRALPARR